VSTFTGTWSLTRFALRRDRVRIVVWLAAVVALVVVTAASTKGLYPTQADLDAAARASEDNPAALAFNGPAQALDTIGGQIAFQVGAIGLVLVGLMSILMVARLTRGEEESGRAELIGSMAVGRHAGLAAGLVVVALMDVVVGVLVALALVALALPVAGSVALGMSFTALGLVFVAVTAVTAQVTESSRVAAGLAGAVLGVSYALRAVGDVGSGALSWLSPIGIAQKARPYAGEVWWPLALELVLALLLAAAAAVLVSHRDFGGGLVAPRAGPPRASSALGHPVGLAVRLERGIVFWWAFAVLLTGVAYGSIANSIEEFITDNEAISDLLASAGGASLVDSYLATSLLVLALIAGGAAIQMALRPRTEEGAGRAEDLLATPLGRPHWLGAHLVVAFVGSALIMVAGGVGTGATYGLVIDDWGQVPRLVGAALVQVPAVWVLVGAACALYGLLPRLALVAWAVLAWGFLVAMFGELIDLPQWLRDLSPLQHSPQAPARATEALPLVVLVVVAAGLTVAGLVGFRRRDLG
jgi:ABC-2 type transport system permease protein